MRYIYIVFVSILVALCSCDKNDDLTSIVNTGSPRDWTFTDDQVEVYIDGQKVTTVSEITVSSIQLDKNTDTFPYYSTTLKIKGLVSKKKVTNIEVLADVERFEGTTELNGLTYNVHGVFTGSPFDHYTNMGIIVYLEKQ